MLGIGITHPGHFKRFQLNELPNQVGEHFLINAHQKFFHFYGHTFYFKILLYISENFISDRYQIKKILTNPEFRDMDYNFTCISHNIMVTNY